MVLTMPHDAKAVDTMINAMKKMVAWGCLEMPGGAERNPEYALRFFVDLGALFLPLDASPCRSWAHSHSIINGSFKALIRLVSTSNRAGFTVRCTATSSGIPSRSFHHRSTSIESSRRVHDGPAFEIYRGLSIRRTRSLDARADDMTPRGEMKETLASNALSCCRIESLRRFFYRHSATALKQHP